MAKKIQFELEALNRKFNESVNESAKRTENLEKSLSKVAKVSTIAFAGLGAAIGGAVAQASKIEDITTQFEVLTGSVNGATKAVEQLQEFSATTPFSFEQVAQAGKQLLAFGFEVDQITEKLNEIGDVAAASGKDVGTLTTVYGQVAAAGRLTGERLRQLQEAAVPIGPALANAMGVAESSVRDLVSKGAVDFATFEKAFRSLSEEGGFAFGGLEKASGTLSGKISTLKDNFALVSNEVGKAFLPILKQGADAMIGFLNNIRNNPALIEQAQQFLKVGLVATGLTSGITILALAFIKLKTAAAGAAVVLGAIASPLLLIKGAAVVLLAAIGGLALGWDKNLSFIENFTVVFVNRIKALFSGLAAVIKGAFDISPAEIKAGLDEIKAAFASSNDELESKRDEIADKRRERIAQEIEDEKEKIAELERLEIEANAARAERKDEQAALDEEKQIEEAEKKRMINEEMALLDQEQIAQLNEQEKQQLEEFLGSQESARLSAAKAQFNQRKMQRTRDLEVERDFGKSYLKLHQMISSERFQAASNLAAQNVRLAQSSNDTISGIGKIAAITQIGTDAARGAMAAFSNAVAAFPPPAGPILGGTLAAAQIAFGAEQINRVRGAKDGALVEGKMGGDVNPFMLEKGELVVPRKNFDAVVTDAAERRIQEDEGESESSIKEILIGFTDDAFEIIEQKLLERRAIGVGSL